MIEKTLLYLGLKHLGHAKVMETFMNLKVCTGMTDTNIVNFANSEQGLDFSNRVKSTLDKGESLHLAVLQVCKQYKEEKLLDQYLTMKV
jgi:hypothetical protein